MNYLETAEFILRGAPRHIFIVDKMFQAGVADGCAEGLEFLVPALGCQFDAAVGQSTHGAGNIKSGGHGFRGVAKADALHMAGIQDVQTAAVRDWRAFGHAGM